MAEKWTRAKIKKLSPDEFEKHQPDILAWVQAGAPEGKSADDPSGVKLPDNYKLSAQEVASMSDEEFSANAALIRNRIAAGEID